MTRSGSLSIAFTLLIAATGAGALVHDAGAQVHLWSQRFGTPSKFDRGRSVAVNESGRLVITGQFQDQIDFGGGRLFGGFSWTGFVASFDPAGEHLWSRDFGGFFDDVRGQGAAIDDAGNVYLTGHFVGSLSLGGPTLRSTGGGRDTFVAKLDPAGKHVWSRTFGITSTDEGAAITVDDSGNVVVIGIFRGVADFGGGSVVSSGLDDVFAVKLDPDGNHVWSRTFGDVQPDAGNAVTVDASGNTALTGRHTGGIFVVKLDPDGNDLWELRAGGPSEDQGMGIATDARGSVVVTGLFRETVDFGGGALTSAGGADVFVATLDRDGRHVWSERFGDSESQWGSDVAVDPLGNVILTGTFGGVVDLGGGALTSSGDLDIFVARFTPVGGHVWSRSFGAVLPDVATAVAVDGLGHVALTGHVNDVMDFGGGPVAGGVFDDVFLAKFASAGVISSITDIGNDQGRRVRLTFLAAAHDRRGSPTPVRQYEAFRRIEPLSSRSGATPSTAGVAPVLRHVGHATPLSDQTLLDDGWEFAGAVPAHQMPKYNMVAPTLADSTADHGVQWSVFFIRAATDDPGIYYDSPPDSGYSSDDLAPNVPLEFVATADAEDVFLHWMASDAEDFRFYTLYRGAQLDFVPGEANRIARLTTTSYVDLGAVSQSERHYKVSATDFAGNESSFALADAPTPVLLHGLEAASTPGGVRLTWRLPAGVVSDLIGVVVQRAGTLEGPYEDRTDPPLIPEESMVFEDADVTPGRTFWYRLELHGITSATEIAGPVRVTATGEDGRTTLGVAWVGDRVEIRYRVGRPGTPVRLEVYDVRGRLARVIDRGTRAPGEYVFTWDGRDESGRRLARGIYLVQLTADDVRIVRKTVRL